MSVGRFPVRALEALAFSIIAMAKATTRPKRRNNHQPLYPTRNRIRVMIKISSAKALAL